MVKEAEHCGAVKQQRTVRSLCCHPATVEGSLEIQSGYAQASSSARAWTCCCRSSCSLGTVTLPG